MSYYETDSQAIDWFERSLTHHNHHVRCEALRLLARVDLARRKEWFARAEQDPDPSVAATAVVAAALARDGARFHEDLLESDFADGLDSPDLMWEWEYAVAVCDGVLAPVALTLAWTREEDDEAAREMAMLKCYAGKEGQVATGTPIIVSKRLVTRYTRSARTFSEAVRWHHSGRPRYGGP